MKVIGFDDLSHDQQLLVTYLVMEASMTEDPEDMMEVEDEIISEVMTLNDQECRDILTKETK